MHIKMKQEFDPEIKVLESQFIGLIRNRLGIVMHSHQSYELYKTIQEACSKFNCTPSEYLHNLLGCPDQSAVLDHLVAGITVGETYFFRDQQQMSLLQDYLLPTLIKNKRDQHSLSLRIWSAGCATGEEIYSVSMMLYELLPDIEQWTIKLLATDINTSALQKALIASYSDWSMRSISDYFKRKYFQMENKRFVMLKRIRDLVFFDYLNLNDDSYPSIFNGTNAQDLIICRNVLIYMDSDSSCHLMHRMNQCLMRGGYLLLGASDPINIAGTDFIFNPHKGLLFSRPLEEQQKVPILSSEIKLTHKLPKKIQYVKPIKRVSKKADEKKSVTIDSLELITRATELANLGKLEEAVKLCEEGFKFDPTNKLHYFTYGLALSELNKFPEAEAAMRKALFLDNQFVAGHFQLGLLLLRKKQHAAGLKSLRNALSIAEARVPEETVPGSPGLCYKRLAEILKNEINLYMTART